MYRMVMIAETMPKLKQKLQDAADAIKTEAEIEKDTIDESYEHPQTEAVNTSPSRKNSRRSADSELENASPARPIFNVNTDNSGSDDSNASVGDESFDSRGVPWNAEIHASSKAKSKDGSWRYKRNVDMKAAKKIESESVAPAAPAIALPAIPEVPSAQVSLPAFQPPQQPAPVATPVVPVQQQAAPALVPPPPPVHQQTAVHSLETFKANLPMTLANLVSAKKLTQEYIAQLCGYLGVTAIYEVVKDDTKAQTLYDLLVQYGMIERVG